MSEKLNIVIPQWQGGGQDFCTWQGAYALRDNYLQDDSAVTVPIEKGDISPVQNNILGYEDILGAMDQVNAVLKEKKPAKIFTLGGGCDADTPCAAWLNQQYAGDLAVLYIDAHGDLNTPVSSTSKFYYGMSLRALAGEGDPEILRRLAATVKPSQLIMCANRNLDPEEIRYKKACQVSDFPVSRLEEDPSLPAKEVIRKGLQHVYIHIDLDSTDPKEFSLTPVPEPDGLKCSTLLSILQAVRESEAQVVGFGILEYAGTMADKGNSLIESLVRFGKEI
jgi:arginase